MNRRSALEWSPGALGPLLGDSDMHWAEFAACPFTDPDAFFVEGKGTSPEPAKRVCRGCKVRLPCLEYALAANEKWGVWGGFSERQRARLRNSGTDPAGAIAADEARRRTAEAARAATYRENLARQRAQRARLQEAA